MESSELKSLKNAALRASQNTHSFKGKPEERKKLKKYDDWIVDEYPGLSIRSMAIAIRKHGVDLSISSLRRYVKAILVDRGVIRDNTKSIKDETLSQNSINHEVPAERSHTKSTPELIGNNELESASSGGETIPNENKSSIKNDTDSRPQWVIDQEQKKLREEQRKEEELRDKPWKDPRLTMDERRRLQTEYVTKNAESVFKLKK
ncbi:hypothetical protein [Vreelandella arcis]|uniref:Uncharacterized protein n=1 Tax=Vreelandella arcis TaxID=416873 RepID=A0A1H0JUP2_9GAMM|nr:hypothetical protein [Halomonas arcis]SDO47131.1 hypothetical protein SAMN04487951_1339 [Halomonas arcis]